MPRVRSRLCKEVAAGLWKQWFQDRGLPAPTVNDPASALASSLWGTCGTELVAGEVKAVTLKALGDLAENLIKFFFPESYTGRRHHIVLEQLLATIVNVKGLLELRHCRSQPWARRVCALFTPQWHEIFTVAKPDIAQVAELLLAQRAAISGRGPNGEAVLYQMFTRSTPYIGKAIVKRSHKQAGPVVRLFEHLTPTVRHRHPEARHIRCKRWRPEPLKRVNWVIEVANEHSQVKAAETVAIRSQRPVGNDDRCCSPVHDGQ